MTPCPTDGPLADRQGYPRTETIADAMVVCPHWGSDRLIPLSFPQLWREVRHLGQTETRPRPIIKCVRYGEPIYVSLRFTGRSQATSRDC
jgi:hypothetical protein